MIVFDTDVLTDILRGVPRVVERAMLIPPDEQAVPIVGAEEILRGRLNAIPHDRLRRSLALIASGSRRQSKTATTSIREPSKR